MTDEENIKELCSLLLEKSPVSLWISQADPP